MYISVLEALLDDKVNMNKNLIKFLDVYSVRGDSFKSVFFEMIIRKALNTIVEYSIANKTILTDISFIEVYIDDKEIDRINQKIVKDYKNIRNKFYIQDKNIIDDILNESSILSERIKQQYK